MGVNRDTIEQPIGGVLDCGDSDRVKITERWPKGQPKKGILDGCVTIDYPFPGDSAPRTACTPDKQAERVAKMQAANDIRIASMSKDTDIYTEALDEED